MNTRLTRSGAVVAGVAALAVLVAACGGTPAASPLTDPTAILEAAAKEAAAATSVHLDAKADGSFSLDLTGAGSGTPLQLTGSTANADIDMKGGDARATFVLPGVLGLRGELIAVDGTAYLKTSLTGPNYRTTTLGSAGGGTTAPSGSPDTASMLATLTAFLARPELAPTKGDDVDCGSTKCYTVAISLTPDELKSLTGGTGAVALPSALPVPMPDLSDVSLDLTIQVTKDTTQLAGLTAVVRTGTPDASGASGGNGDATVQLTFSKWNEPVTVTAPPADQVTAG